MLIEDVETLSAETSQRIEKVSPDVSRPGQGQSAGQATSRNSFFDIDQWIV